MLFFAAAFMFMLFAAFCCFFHESIASFDYCYPLPLSVSLLCLIAAFPLALTSRRCGLLWDYKDWEPGKARLGYLYHSAHMGKLK
jgi:hypothetical protein